MLQGDGTSRVLREHVPGGRVEPTRVGVRGLHVVPVEFAQAEHHVAAADHEHAAVAQPCSTVRVGPF